MTIRSSWAMGPVQRQLYHSAVCPALLAAHISPCCSRGIPSPESKALAKAGSTVVPEENQQTTAPRAAAQSSAAPAHEKVSLNSRHLGHHTLLLSTNTTQGNLHRAASFCKTHQTARAAALLRGTGTEADLSQEGFPRPELAQSSGSCHPLAGEVPWCPCAGTAPPQPSGSGR